MTRATIPEQVGGGCGPGSRRLLRVNVVDLTPTAGLALSHLPLLPGSMGSQRRRVCLSY